MPLKSYSLIIALALLSAGCGRSQKTPSPEDAEARRAALAEEQYDIKVDSPLVYSEPSVFEQGLGLHAQSDGASVVISALNSSDGPIVVGPRNFALITGPDRTRDLIILNPTTANLRQFVPMRLKPGERGLFTFTLNEYRDLKGTLLIYRNLDLEFEMPVRVQ